MIRKATEQEIDDIIHIYNTARSFMRKNGNATQWSNGYPQRSLLEYDIEQKRLFVLEDGAGIYGVFMLLAGPDPTYAVIKNGRWMDESPYIVIHRVASSGRRGGVMHEILDFAFSLCPHIRIDTHANNAPMQKVLIREGFSRTGIIVCDDGTDRIAFEKVL